MIPKFSTLQNSHKATRRTNGAIFNFVIFRLHVRPNLELLKLLFFVPLCALSGFVAAFQTLAYIRLRCTRATTTMRS